MSNDGNVIPFRRKDDRPTFWPVQHMAVGGTITMYCTSLIHYFAERSEPCQCGRERWPEETP